MGTDEDMNMSAPTNLRRHPEERFQVSAPTKLRRHLEERFQVSAPTKLRRHPEERFQVKPAALHRTRTDVEAQRLLNELQVHQIELEMQNAELVRARNEVELLHADLTAHSAELEFANIELEAFNYRVSHDLHTPLTVINGFCQVIQTHCDTILDEQSKECLRKIHEATLRMNGLIEALLNFSRVAHVEMRREPIDFSAMAKDVAAELGLAEPERRVSFRIPEGIMAVGDAALLRVVLDNLMGNACKYGASPKGTVIEFGVAEFDGSAVWFVRDNGSGFDMASAGNLFMPFQRISHMDVEGHGIGLSTVERIVMRHGGRVWAKSEPGKGATFLFTLGVNPRCI